MRTLLTFFVFLPFLSFAQVGVNTTTPNAALDIQSTNNGVLIPRVQLTDALDIVTVVNPAGGALSTSTLVYNITPAGIAPNIVTAGFYYWDGAKWIPISGNPTTDSDWYKEGTTTPPNNINEDMFHIGNVAIGKNTATYPLEVESTNFDIGIHNKFVPTILNGITNHAIHNDINNTIDEHIVGFRTDLIDSGRGITAGSIISIAKNNDGGMYGNLVDIYGSGTTVATDECYGTYNSISNNGIGKQFANINYVDGSGSGLHYGTYNWLAGIGSNNQIATRNIITNTGGGIKYGTQTTIFPAAGGTHYGIYSEVLKPGATNFAGYFLGNVGIGTTASNTYTLPPSRGTMGQVMQTDGLGNVSWNNPSNSSWTINGNSAITTPANPITYGTSTLGATENFMGTTDANDVTFATNNIERMRIKNTTGNIGIGTSNPTKKLDIVAPNNEIGLQILSGNNSQLSYLSLGRTIEYAQIGACITSRFFLDALDGDMAIKNFGAGKILLGASVNTNADMSIVPGGNVGIGTVTPTSKLHIVNATSGALRIVDGTQANGNVLRSDANGVGTWQNPNTFSWSLTGNAVNAATNFIGSTNNANVIFKRDNTLAGSIAQFNTSLGVNSLLSITTGTQNVAIGTNALDSNIVSGGNTAVGYDALQSTTGDFNTAFGNSSLFSLGVGTSNCAFGYNALTGLTSGVNNIGIGTNAVVPSSTGSNQIRMGNTAITYAGIQVAWAITSDKRWKSAIQTSNLGLDFITKLNPVSYIRKNDESKKTEYGFIAQELDQTLNEFGATNSGIITKDDAGMLSVRYNDLLSPMVKAIQELKTENDILKKQNESLEARLKKIEEKINN